MNASLMWQIVYRGVDVTPMAIHRWSTAQNTITIPKSSAQRDLVLAGASPLNADASVTIRACRVIPHDESATCAITDEIWYGGRGVFANVTDAAREAWRLDDTVVIPRGDEQRATAVGDPHMMVLKSILIVDSQSTTTAPIDFELDIAVPDAIGYDAATMVDRVLGYIHRHSTLQHGSFHEEYPEQTMAASFVRRGNKVLELGSNIGRNTIVIAKLLESSANLVTLETDPVSAHILETNRVENALEFAICNAALSKRKLAQLNWNCVPYGDNEPIPADHTPVATVTWDALRAQYCSDGRPFDTLVADCEGALYWILLDEPDFMLGFETVIVENDYCDIDHYNRVKEAMTTAGLQCMFVRAGGFGPCYNFFYEVWQRNATPAL